MAKNVQMPDGSVIQFPDGMADQEISNAIQTQYRPGVPAAPVPQGLQGPPAQPSTLDKVGDVVGNFGKGMAKGAVSTLASTDDYVRKIPGIGEWLTTPVTGTPADQAIAHTHQMAQTHGTAQAIGKGVEQVGEYLVPGEAEGVAAGKLATVAPKLGKLAAPLARTAVAALSTGTVAKAQGGNFGTGAVMGAGGGALSEGLRAVAPLVAESALGVRNADRRAPITPGRAILDETTGVNARKIADQATAKQGLYVGERNALLQKAPPVDLTPARQVAKDAQGVAARQNNPDTIKRTGDLSNLLTFEGGKTPQPTAPQPNVIPGFGNAAAAPPAAPSNLIPPVVSARRATDLKEGLGDLKNSWNPATPNKFADAAVGRTYGTLDKTIDNAAPGTSALNDKTSALFPVAARANATDLNAGVMQRVMGRLTRPTGALFSAGLGGEYGREKAGIPGAIAGAGIGLLAPELIGSPTAQMLMARGMNKGATPVVRTLLGGALQADPKKSLYGQK